MLSPSSHEASASRMTSEPNYSSYRPAITNMATAMDTDVDTKISFPSQTKINPGTEDDDPFAPLLSLEQDYYTEGYSLGLNDGIRSGRIEGRIFGLEKGFDKFVQMGRLAGRAAVWDARLSALSPPAATTAVTAKTGAGGVVKVGGGKEDVGLVAPAQNDSYDSPAPRSTDIDEVDVMLPPLSGSERLRRHVDRLLELTDPESLETKNTEDTVNECDERLAGAKARFTLISRIVGEGDVEGVGVEIAGVESTGGGNGARTGAAREQSLEDESKEGAEVEITAPRKGKSRGNGKGGVARVGEGKGKGEMEDFGGLPMTKQAGRGT
ncbi:hypothetical protein LTR78_009627 [Recurvomyces mirabilis]|uniref:Essential protein Yae1 N-terminal domain-containing protein n=1 Tax=Recurvomyces mirabilis TaxID=574656 RepID=A0AAE0WIJ6_9PEZI|nr:hypothetical protein LTR78_009627 [Recurvomyces mirabilis]KAK5152135.1 hypothetical protein LTS14_008510 [Recurvomyces mirabilis]